jgi:DNA repair photolyase
MGKMFEFITHTVNPIAGGPCPYECSYCWAKALREKHQWAKYQGEYRLLEKELRHYPQGSFIFVQDMGDIGDPMIPDAIIERIMKWMNEEPSRFLLLTKNPDFYMKWWRILPPNVTMGATIETNRRILSSKAPDPMTRIKDMQLFAEMPLVHNPRFISVEPIMEFDDRFLEEIMEIHPQAVAIGFDNWSKGLPEPSLPRVRELIHQLRARGVKVYVKTMREANQS